MGKAEAESGIWLESYSHLEQQCHTSWEQWSALSPPPLYRGLGSVLVPHFAQGCRLIGLLLPLTPLRLPFSPIPFLLSLTPLLPAMAFKATSPNYAAVRSMWNPADTFFLDISSCKTYSGSLNKPLFWGKWKARAKTYNISPQKLLIWRSIDNKKIMSGWCISELFFYESLLQYRASESSACLQGRGVASKVVLWTGLWADMPSCCSHIQTHACRTSGKRERETVCLLRRKEEHLAVPTTHGCPFAMPKGDHSNAVSWTQGGGYVLFLKKGNWMSRDLVDG